MSFTFDVGFSYPRYLAHLTIGIGKRTLWFTIVTSNWKSFTFRPKQDRFTPLAACFSVFTVTYTD